MLPTPVVTRWGLVASGWSVYALYYLGRVNFSVAVPRLEDEAGLSATEIGALAAGFFWVYSLSAVPVGRLADRYGARTLVGLGLVGSGLLNAAFVLASGDFRLLLVIWSANGIFQAMGWTPLVGALGRWVEADRSARVIASFGSCFVAGTALTFAAGGFIIERGGVDAVFVTAFLVLVPIGVVWWIGVRDQVPEASPADQASGSISAAIWLLPPAAALGVAYVALIVWAPAYFVEVHGVSVGSAGLLSSMMPAVSIVVTIALGRWFLRIPHAPGVVLRGGAVLLLTAVALAAVSRAAGLGSGVVAVATATALVGASSSVVMGLYPRVGSPDGVSLTSGVFALAFNLGGGAGSPLMGRLVGQDDWDVAFLFLAGSVLVGALWSYGWYARARPRHMREGASDGPA
ncbi:MAG: MFS transporter [bacterium]|nr:MFS transporter [bacterium]